MSTNPPSRCTLADLILLINLANLTERQKQDLRSAVLTIARLLGADPATIPANMRMLQRRLADIAPEAHGLSRGRWANIRSLFGKALALALPTMPGRSGTPLLPEWEQLTASLRAERRFMIIPLARFMSAQGIGPDRLKACDLEAYHDAILNNRLRSNPEKAWARFVRSWNICMREISGWPQIKIDRPSRREILLLAWSVFPTSFKQDCDAYLDRLSGRDLADEGPVRALRPATVDLRAYQIRLAASALVHRGSDGASIRSLSDLVTIERYQEILRFLLGRHGGQTSPQCANMAACLKAIARHWAKVDGPTLDKMKRIATRVAVPYQGMTPRNRQRLSHLDDPEMVERFLELPHRIRREVAKDKRSPRLKAIAAQTAAAIGLLQAAPIRIKNLSELDIEKNLIARGGRLYLSIPAEDTKNRQPIDFELPPEVADLLAWYVRDHRPLLIKAPTSALFPGEKGPHKHPITLAGQISNAVFRYTGMKFNVHLFRHAAGKIFLDRRPGEYEIVRRVLGHRSIATTTSIYTGAETRSAGQYFAKVISERRRGLEPPPKAAATKPKLRGGRQ